MFSMGNARIGAYSEEVSESDFSVQKELEGMQQRRAITRSKEFQVELRKLFNPRGTD